MISRRTLLRAAGACVPLPLLPSLLPRAAWGATPSSPRRLIYFYVPCGLQLEEIVPDRDGPNYDLKQITAPLAGVQEHVSILSGLEQGAGYDSRAGDHARGTGCFLTATTVKYTAGEDIENGVSVDQIAAQQLGGATLLPSLQLGIDGGGSTGDCDSGYSCAYARNISWADSATPLPNITDPGVAFSRLFAGAEAGLTPEEQARRTMLRSSVLDLVLDQANSLQGRLGSSDRLKLDEYLTGVRELEQKIQAQATQVCLPGDEPPDEFDYPAQVTLMCDLITLALDCDMTRFVTFMLGNGGSSRAYPFIGVSRGHHEISHHMDDPANLADLYAIEAWEVEQYAYLIGKLAATTTSSGGNLLDDTLVYFSSEIADGNSHSHSAIPVLLAGRGGGAHTPGRHVRYTNAEPMANLFIAMLESVGVTVGSFGEDGYAPLGGLV